MIFASYINYIFKILHDTSIQYLETCSGEYCNIFSYFIEYIEIMPLYLVR